MKYIIYWTMWMPFMALTYNIWHVIYAIWNFKVFNQDFDKWIKNIEDLGGGWGVAGLD